MELNVGDKISIDGYITILEEIKYDLFAQIYFYWFYNEQKQYVYNIKEFITKIK